MHTVLGLHIASGQVPHFKAVRHFLMLLCVSHILISVLIRCYLVESNVVHLKASLICFLHAQSCSLCTCWALQFCCCLFLRALKDFYGLHSQCKFLWPHSNGAVCGCTDGLVLWLSVQSTSASPAGLFSLHLCKRFCRRPADASVPSSSEGRPSLVCALVDVGLTGCTSCVQLVAVAHNACPQISFMVKRTDLCKDTAFTLSFPVFILVWLSLMIHV